MGNGKIHFEDVLFVRWSSDDGCWTAHSLETDQIGFGDSIVDALADVIKAVHQVIALAESDPTIAALRKAPDDVIEAARRAKRLPQEMYEVAHLRATDDWPSELTLTLDGPPEETYTVHSPVEA